MRSGLAQWFIHGEWDTEWWREQAVEWSPGIAGAIFGAAWWAWADAIVYEKAIEHHSPPFKYNWPGIIATLALIFINLISRADLRDIADSGEEGSNVSCLKTWKYIDCMSKGHGIHMPLSKVCTIVICSYGRVCGCCLASLWVWVR